MQSYWSHAMRDEKMLSNMKVISTVTLGLTCKRVSVSFIWKMSSQCSYELIGFSKMATDFLNVQYPCDESRKSFNGIDSEPMISIKKV